MLDFLKRKHPLKQRPSPPTIGDDRRVYAIGDIHGRIDLLREMLDLLGADDRQRAPLPVHVILLGDLINRGPASAQVVEQAIALSRLDPNIRFIKGNHEEVFIRAARGDERAAHFFCRIGGAETLVSYGLPLADQADMTDTILTQWMLDHIPRAHVDFLDAFEDSVDMGDYLFVHAGIRPGIAIDAQDPADLRWIREEFLSHDQWLDRIIVHGHSITDDVDERHNRIGIDTGAYYSGRLTAIGLQGQDRWFISTGRPD